MQKPASGSGSRSLAPLILAVLTEAIGADMAGRIMVGSCSILTIDQDELSNDNFDMFVKRMEIVIPSLIGIKPGAAVVNRLRRLQDDARS